MKLRIIGLIVAMLAAVGCWYVVDPLLPTKIFASLGNQKAAGFMAREALGNMDAEGYAYWMGFVEMPTPKTLYKYDAEIQQGMKLLWEAQGGYHESNNFSFKK